MQRALTRASIDCKAYVIGGARAWRAFSLIKRHIELAWLGIEPLLGVLAYNTGAMPFLASACPTKRESFAVAV